MTALDTRISQYSEAVDTATADLLASAPSHQGLYDMLRYHLGWVDRSLVPSESPGKKLRPTLCLLIAEAVGGDWRPALSTAVAIELMHNFSLIHDDIEDGSRLRRHRETLWSVWGSAHGVNAGDALFVVAAQALFEVSPALPPPLALHAHRRLLQSCRELCEGQYLDLLWQTTPSITVGQYLQMIERKAARLFECACELGAYTAGGAVEVQQQFGAFGRALGMAFQAADDLMGIWGQEGETGKSAAIDLASRKKTLPVVLGLAAPPGRAADRLRGLFAMDRPLTAEEVGGAARLLEDLGARAEAQRLFGVYRDEALRRLAAAVPDPWHSTLRSFVDLALPPV